MPASIGEMNMRIPSATSLTSAFRDLDRKQANLIRRIAKARNDAEKLSALIERHCPNTHAGALQSYGRVYDSGMWRTTMALRAMDEILGTHGVETIGKAPDFRSTPPYEYLNAGDTYATTLIYTHATDTVRIGCWGDIAERMSARDLEGGAW